jgi:uncharacterized BrkB/YihY/UPF0761 family membrane protein
MCSIKVNMRIFYYCLSLLVTSNALSMTLYCVVRGVDTIEHTKCLLPTIVTAMLLEMIGNVLVWYLLNISDYRGIKVDRMPIKLIKS